LLISNARGEEYEGRTAPEAVTAGNKKNWP